MAAAKCLLVKGDFLDHRFGDRITDPATIRQVLQTHPDFVLREAVTEPVPIEKNATSHPDAVAAKKAAADGLPAPKRTTHTLND